MTIKSIRDFASVNFPGCKSRSAVYLASAVSHGRNKNFFDSGGALTARPSLTPAPPLAQLRKHWCQPKRHFILITVFSDQTRQLLTESLVFICGDYIRASKIHAQYFLFRAASLYVEYGNRCLRIANFCNCFSFSFFLRCPLTCLFLSCFFFQRMFYDSLRPDEYNENLYTHLLRLTFIHSQINIKLKVSKLKQHAL